MKVTILHNPVPPDAPPEVADVLAQVQAVEAACHVLGHRVARMAFPTDLAQLREALFGTRPDVVFNLVEYVLGEDKLQHISPAILEVVGVPFTGASQVATILTTNKLTGKRFLASAGLPTPDWWEAQVKTPCPPPAPGDRVIIKSVWEHGSVGLDEDSIVTVDDPATVIRHLSQLADRTGRTWFAERFVDGREFNLSVIAGLTGPDVLPQAEIRFEGYGPDKPKVVGYRAKWDVDSYEYHHTNRTFDHPPEDEPLLADLSRLAKAAWVAFDLHGYARKDFRVDPAGRPFILEINTNPCIAPDAGFAAAVARAGMTYADAVARILHDATPQRPPWVLPGA
jgi:D-alanine-D-alanine ligase